MKPTFSSHAAFADPSVRHALDKTAVLAPEVQPIMPVSATDITIPMYWPGDEPFEGLWDMKEYTCEPRGILRVGSKFRHQLDAVGRVQFHQPVEEVPEVGSPSQIADALRKKYGHMGLIILGADSLDEQRKVQARKVYVEWRTEKAKENIARHRAACERAMKNGVSAPPPPESYERDRMFLRAYESNGNSGRFVCQLDGSRFELRSEAWKHVRDVDITQAENPNAVLDTMAHLADPESVAVATATREPKLNAMGQVAEPKPERVLDPADPLAALRSQVAKLYERALDEEITIPKPLRDHLKSNDIEILQLAIEEATTLIEGPAV